MSHDMGSGLERKKCIHLTCCVLHSHCHNGHEDEQEVNNGKK